LTLSEWASVMRAPGEGLLRVSTGLGSSFSLLKGAFSSKQYLHWPEEFLKRISNLKKGPFQIIGIPSDSGGGICRGAAHGPLHIRKVLYAKHKDWAKNDLGDIPCIPQLLSDNTLSDKQREASSFSLWGRKGRPASPLNLLEEFLVSAWLETPHFRPLILGGDHSVAYPIFRALKRVGLQKDLAVLHIDAHTDLAESRFGIEICFGTWTHHILKDFSDPRMWVQLGIRTSGHKKDHWISKYGHRQDWTETVLKKDPKKYAQELVTYWKSLGCKNLYITHDIDGTDGKEAPSTGTPEEKGLKSAWLRKVLSHVTESLPLIGSDLVEVAPVIGSKQDIAKTLKVSREYIEALHWHKIR